jgi:redox-sensitive bicupin YhaK (pirin superfamily)
MLDYFNSKLPAGFPDHPHRGFETVSYMKSGQFFHEDFKGNRGVINEGDVQWMTAGKGKGDGIGRHCAFGDAGQF